MANKHLLRNSHKIDENKWWYEVNGGIEIIIYPKFRPEYLKITWKALRAALSRKDKPCR